MHTDLLGDPTTLPEYVKRPRHKQPQCLTEELERFLSIVNDPKKAARFASKLERSPSCLLFADVLEQLKQPILRAFEKRRGSKSDREGVALIDEDGDILDGALDPEIPYERWGETWISDVHGLEWSVAGVWALQQMLLWESLEELTLHNNEREKWSVLKWVFMPAIKKHYVFDKRINRSHCFQVHEREETFSFRNCCRAEGLDPDVLRDLIRYEISPDIYQAVLKVVTF